ncbi:hypothetical protein LOTGIDRAFT_169106 [Lottia gigantea]|uniref:Nephrocystin 3-like N-terminal domain-containing protein n=1 Tax=Lottia gigantea TaxID=225164 RepID=V4B594_LOTGI|nr:hypothetical protein LOTGIDRAFT_169106 [Lottia gigantea]ESO83634.1 hypothetical protein LOTGIDRAFT_169106 [Lottia gigantea]
MVATDGFELRQPIKPYICSTIEDFEVERKYLSKVIFPKLKQFCLQRGAQFMPFDNLWSKKDTDFQHGRLLHLLLKSAECSPFLICLIGERYGVYRQENSPQLPDTVAEIPEDCSAIDKNFLIAALNGHSWILDQANQNLSIFELEIIQAAFLRDATFGYFYFRQTEHLEEKLAHLHEREHEKFKTNYFAENEHAGLKVADLKQRIVKKGLTVKYFKTIEELGSLVLEDWKTVIDQIYPPLANDGDFLDTEEYREWVHQQCLYFDRKESYVSSEAADAVITQLSTFAISVSNECSVEFNSFTQLQMSALEAHEYDRKMKEKRNSILVLAGDRGVGKSSLIVEWLGRISETNPELPIIHYFIGCSKNSTDIAIILRHFISQLKQRMNGKRKQESMVDVDQMKSFQELTESFSACISSIPCIILLDGLDELGGSLGQTPQEVKDFGWLPQYLPSHCKIIFTTSRSDLTFHSLSKRNDVQTLTIKSLVENTQKPLILMENMKFYYQRLSKHNLKQISEIQVSQKPLFLRLLASEMSCYNVYRDLTEYLDDFYELCSVREFWIRSLQRWVRDYSWYLDSATEDGITEEELETTGWVPDVLRLLVLSRDGLTQSDILSLLHQLGYRRNKQVTQFDWMFLQQCLSNNLREDSNGLIKFSHQHLTEVAEYTLFKSIKQAAGEIHPTEESNQRRIFHQHLAIYFLKQPFSHRQLDELPWHLLMSGNFHNLINILTSEKYLPYLLDIYMKNPTDRYNLIYYWSILIKHGYNPVTIYRHYLTTIGLADLHDNDQNMQDLYRRQSLELSKNSVKNETNTFLTAITDYRQLSVIEEKDEMDKEKSVGDDTISYLGDDEADDKELCVFKEMALSEVASITWYISQLLLELGYNDSTLEILTVLAQYLQKNRPLGLLEELIYTRSLECVGNIYLVNKQYYQSYLYYKRSLRALLQLQDSDDEQIYETESHILKGSILSQLGKLKMLEGNFYEAEDLYREALDSLDKIPDCQPMKANIEYNLGLLRVNYNKAIYLYRRALTIREKCLGSNHTLIAEILVELGSLIQEESSYKAKTEAKSCLSRALDIKTQHLGANHQEVKVLLNLLTNVEVAIKLGQYQFGSARPTDHRSKYYPYSSLSFRDHDLKDLKSREKERQHHDRLSMFRSYSTDSLYRIASPGSALSQISASEKLLLENERPHLAKRDIQSRQMTTSAVNHPAVPLLTPVTGLKTLARRQLNNAEISCELVKEDEKNSQVEEVNSQENVIDNYASRVVSPEQSSPPQPVSEVRIEARRRPTSAPLSLYNKFNPSNRFLHQRPKKSRNLHSALSMVSSKSLPLRPRSEKGCHAARCQTPGPHAISLSTTRSIAGPNSSINSLLGPPEAPRDVHQQIHHKMAWYHVPGRYSTNASPFPPKRSQHRPGSNFAVANLQHDVSTGSKSLDIPRYCSTVTEVLYDVDENGDIIPLSPQKSTIVPYTSPYNSNLQGLKELTIGRVNI